MPHFKKTTLTLQNIAQRLNLGTADPPTPTSTATSKTPASRSRSHSRTKCLLSAYENTPILRSDPFDGFSTKHTDRITDVLYYGYRYYDTHAGRWLSRDPSGEVGGINLNSFVDNSPVDNWDLLGLLKAGDKFNVKHKEKVVGTFSILQYSKGVDGPTRGAILKISSTYTDCDCGLFFKWRQRFSDLKDGKPVDASQLDPKRFKYYNGPKKLENVLDIRYDAPLTGAEWYPNQDGPGGIPEACDYPFIDFSRQVPPTQGLSSDPDRIEVKFVLELVGVKTKNQLKGGDVLYRLTWGYYFTKETKEHGLFDLTPDPQFSKP